MVLADLTHAQTAVATLLDRFDTDDWERPSPCERWDVGGVVRHLVVGERAFTLSLGGRAYDLASLTDQVHEVPSVDLPAAYAEAAGRLRSALAGADPAASFPTGLGLMPAPAVEQLRTIEALVHGWDVGRGAGRLQIHDDVLERALEHSRALMKRLPPDRTPFSPPVPLDDGAPPLDRLVALLGRDPHAAVTR
jgi:uncharacterized protein (TIGR03086 family)